MMPSFSCPLPVHCGGGRWPESLADAPQDYSTTEASPRTVLIENICRYVQHIRQHFPTTMPFLTVSAITYSWMASTAPQADSWWPGHVEPHDVVIVDIAGQALNIFLHGPESAHKNGIVKTFTHTSIPINPRILLKKTPHKQQKQNAQLTKHDAFIYWSSSCPVCWKATFRMFGTCSTSEALSPKTILIENICESVQQILQHSLAEINAQLTKHDACCLTGPLLVQCGGRRRPGSLTDAPQDCSKSGDFSPRTVLTKIICRCIQHKLQHFPKGNTLSNSFYNILFLDGFNSSPGWLLVTRTRGAWWCRYRGHCRSGPRHLSPRSRVCAQEWHSEDIHSHIHSHPATHTPIKKNQKKNQLTKHDAFFLLSSSCPVWWWATFINLAPAPQDFSTSEAF